MAESPVWIVELAVEGPVSVRGHFHTTKQKGFRVDDPFYTDVEIHGVPYGLQVTLTARACDEALAFEAGVFFFGKMLDALTLTVDRPMYLTRGERDHRHAHRSDVRRVIETVEFEDAFREAHDLASDIHSRPFLRSLGWYRKGLQVDDPFDKFLSFWNAIEIVASAYWRDVPSNDTPRAKNGSKSQVWECLKALWGPCDQWPVAGGNATWIDDNYEIRKNIAHGITPVDIKEIAYVAAHLDMIRRVAHKFLTDWHRERRHAEVATRSESVDVDDSVSLALSLTQAGATTRGDKGLLKELPDRVS